MKLFNNFYLLFSLLFVLLVPSMINGVGASSELWSKTFGTTKDDRAKCMIATSDGGYAIVGTTDNYGDGMFVKIDEDGFLEWQQKYTILRFGSNNVRAVVEASDGGYVIGGGNILLKVNRQGAMQWHISIGIFDFDGFAYSMVKTSDGGYVITGYEYTAQTGTVELGLIKVAQNGTIQWKHIYNNPQGNEYGRALAKTPDGGYIIACENWPGGAFVPDFLLVKTDEYGNIQWNKTYPGVPGFPQNRAIITTSDSGFAVAGQNMLMKTDAAGNPEWNQTYGGKISSLIQVSDGGYVLAGEVSVPDNNVDGLLTKTDAQGNILWNQTYGGTGLDNFNTILETPYEGYIIAGTTTSFGKGQKDFWLIKTDEYGTIPEFPSWTILPLLMIGVLAVVIFKKKL